eukprot:519520-Amorphochlora_amoeboformis.AAC.2
MLTHTHKNENKQYTPHTAHNRTYPSSIRTRHPILKVSRPRWAERFIRNTRAIRAYHGGLTRTREGLRAIGDVQHTRRITGEGRWTGDLGSRASEFFAHGYPVPRLVFVLPAAGAVDTSIIEYAVHHGAGQDLGGVEALISRLRWDV